MLFDMQVLILLHQPLLTRSFKVSAVIHELLLVQVQCYDQELNKQLNVLLNFLPNELLQLYNVTARLTWRKASGSIWDLGSPSTAQDTGGGLGASESPTPPQCSVGGR